MQHVTMQGGHRFYRAHQFLTGERWARRDCAHQLMVILRVATYSSKKCGPSVGAAYSAVGYSMIETT